MEKFRTYRDCRKVQPPISIPLDCTFVNDVNTFSTEVQLIAIQLAQVNRDGQLLPHCSVMWVCPCIPKHIHCLCSTAMAHVHIAVNIPVSELVSCAFSTAPIHMSLFTFACKNYLKMFPHGATTISLFRQSFSTLKASRLSCGQPP